MKMSSAGFLILIAYMPILTAVTPVQAEMLPIARGALCDFVTREVVEIGENGISQQKAKDRLKAVRGELRQLKKLLRLSKSEAQTRTLRTTMRTAKVLRKALIACKNGDSTDIANIGMLACDTPAINGIMPRGDPLNFQELTPTSEGFRFTLDGDNFHPTIGTAPGSQQSIFAYRRVGLNPYSTAAFSLLSSNSIELLVASPFEGQFELLVANYFRGDICLSQSLFESYTDQPLQPICGNGTIEQGEDCDDGNALSNDGCSSNCIVETNGTVDTCTSLSQYDITWTFSTSAPCGQFANGDWWVVGPVTITSMNPPAQNGQNGWQVNPVDSVYQGYDSNGGNYNAALMPTLPYIAQPGQSIVKAISHPSATNRLLQMAVLTVVETIPPSNGSAVFRPAFAGSDKSYYYVSRLQTDLLPSLPPLQNAPSLQWVYDRYKRVQYSHMTGWQVRDVRPSENFGGTTDPYGALLVNQIGDAVLRLMFNDPVAAKMPGIIALVQHGLDNFGSYREGVSWGGTVQMGQMLPMVFAAAMLNDSALQDIISNSPWEHFGEKSLLRFSPVANYGQGAVIWGGTTPYGNQYDNYWSAVYDPNNHNLFRQMWDPYGYIDGSAIPGDVYQFCCSSNAWKGNALALHLVPRFKTITNFEPFTDYVDRWVNSGTSAQPDPCAPVAQGGGHDTQTGFCRLDPDLAYFNSPTDFACQLGRECGRFPERHGVNANSGSYGSNFAGAMWDAYR